MLIRRKRKNIRVASRIQFCGGRPSAPEKRNIRRETLVLPCATYPETARPEAPLSKIFGDQIERVRFARTLRWREMDSNYRFSITRPRFQDRLMSPLPDSPPTEIRSEREPTPRGCLAPSAGPMVRILFPPAANRVRTTTSTFGVIAGRARQPVEPGHRHGVAGSDLVEQPAKLRPVGPGSRMRAGRARRSFAIYAR